MLPRLFTTLPLLLPVVALAQALPPPPCPAGLCRLIVPIGSLGTSCYSLKDYLNGIFMTTIGIAGILAVIIIVICGIKLMGTGSVAGKSEAKQCIWNAIFGVLLAVGSWLLLNTINPLLLKNDAQLTVMSGTTAANAPAAQVVVEPIPRVPGWYYRYIDTNGSTRNSPHYDGSYTCLQFQKIGQDKGVTIDKECFEISPPVPGTPPPPPPAAPAPVVVRSPPPPPAPPPVVDT